MATAKKASKKYSRKAELAAQAAAITRKRNALIKSLAEFTQFQLSDTARRAIDREGPVRFEGGRDKRKFNYHAQLDSAGTLLILAGCREFTAGQALRHWGGKDYYQYYSSRNLRKAAKERGAANVERVLRLYRAAQRWIKQAEKAQ